MCKYVCQKTAFKSSLSPSSMYVDSVAWGCQTWRQASSPAQLSASPPHFYSPLLSFVLLYMKLRTGQSAFIIIFTVFFWGGGWSFLDRVFSVALEAVLKLALVD